MQSVNEIGQGNFHQLFALLNTPQKLALAVSGGSDSTALMFLVADWARKNNRIGDICVLTIDHALRENSACEAKQVCQWANKLGLNSQILTWEHDGQTSRIQEKARTARYQLIANWCHDNNAVGVITAHNADDQAETMLMRLARGSGIDGLAAMSPQTEIFGTTVFRPLLDVSRQDLQEILINADHNWLDDPSNDDEKFERVRVRGGMAAIEKTGITKASLTLSAKRASRASTALEQMTSQFIGQSVTIYNTGHCEINRTNFEELPEEIAIRTLSNLLQWAGGSLIPVRMAKVERLYETLGKADTEKHTLAGAQLAIRKTKFVIGREFGRIEPALQQGVTQWDNRFVFAKPQDVQPYGLFIDNDDRERPPQLPYFVACSLPAFCQENGKLIVPHLDLQNTETIQQSALLQGWENLTIFS